MAGIEVGEGCVQAFQDMRSRNAHRFIIYKIDSDTAKVVVEKLGAATDTFNSFKCKLPPDDCRYAIYNYEFVSANVDSDGANVNSDVHINANGDGDDGDDAKKMEMKETVYRPTFITWAPDGAKVRAKMIYCATKMQLRTKLGDGLLDSGATDHLELDWVIDVARRNL